MENGNLTKATIRRRNAAPITVQTMPAIHARRNAGAGRGERTGKTEQEIDGMTKI